MRKRGSMVLLPLGAVFAVAMAVSGCVTGPKFVDRAVPVPPAYGDPGASVAAGSWKPATPDDAASRGRWWAIFEDARLSELEEQLTTANQNIAAAAAAVQVARAQVRQAQAQFFPTLTVNPAAAAVRLASANGRTLGVTYTAYTLPFEASWEPDLWGRVRHTVSSARFAAEASEADFENVRLSAQAELAVLYWQLRAQDAITQAFGAAVASYEDALAITRDRFDAGLENGEAVAQAETQLTVTRAQATNLGILRAQYEHAIAVLIGEPPSVLAIAVEAFNPTVPMIPAGLPSELLERRPDIAGAQRAVADANEQIGLARTAYFPAALLRATGGFQGLSLAQWITWPARVWSVGPSLAQTIFDGGLRRATVQQYRASYEQTVADYRQTVLTAFQEVEDNLAALRILGQVIAEQDAAVAAAQSTLELAEIRYRFGVDPYLNVIVAQVALLNAQQAAITFRAQRLIASIQLIRALGGGWTVSP